MTNQLIPYNEVEQFGKAMVASGFFQDVKQISQAVVKIQAGAEIGLPPFASMTGVHIIKGKPVLGANLIATLIKNDPRYDYRVRQLDNDTCRVEFFEGGELVGESEFTAQDATDAGINNQNWKKYPRNMLFARAISNGAKWYTPGIFGGMPVYTPDEFDLQVNEDGDVLEGQVVIEQPVAEPEPSKKPQPQSEKKETTVSKQDGRIADLRATIEGAETSTIGLVCDYAFSADVGYNATQHAFNAVKTVDGHGDDKMSDELDTKTALKMFDWLISRKIED